MLAAAGAAVWRVLSEEAIVVALALDVLCDFIAAGMNGHCLQMEMLTQANRWNNTVVEAHSQGFDDRVFAGAGLLLPKNNIVPSSIAVDGPRAEASA